jgi:amino acid adenylation domain-containing protein
VLVGLCLERSLELVVGMLGILKAGGAYLPLDPGYPAARLAYMLADSQAPVLVTQESLLKRLPEHGAQVLCLDRDAERIGRQPITAPEQQATPASLAYVIYTSGSTGKPKGVMIEHHSVVNYLWWLRQTFELSAEDRVLQSTPISFDISVLEVFWPLLVGARVELAPPGAHRWADELIGIVRERGVTVLQVVPSMLAAITEAPGLADAVSLRRVFTAGEALRIDLVRRFHAQSQAELVNGYGPTETTVYSTFWRCTRDETLSVVPIGGPLANTWIYLLDAHGMLVPIGVPGEIFIGGDGLARGYLARSDLTAERFVIDPFGGAQGARYYRTGDRGCYRCDGNIDFLGRVDHQIKIRGFRVEPGEIEAALVEHPAVRQAVVVGLQEAGEVRLAAYVVPATGARVDGSWLAALRRHLAGALPAQLVPHFIQPLPDLPLTANGKIDRKALPHPGSGALPERPEASAPRTPVEEIVARAFAEVLGVAEVGARDDFFDLGGHSLSAVRVLTRLCTDLGVHLPIRTLFETPTVEGIAAVLMSEMAAQGAAALESQQP